MKILLTGGGTLGSVSPLLAIADELRAHGHELVFVGTYEGPERKIVDQAGISFLPMTAPKFRRYMTWRHVLLPFELLWSIAQAKWILLRTRPQLIVSAGGFVSVPLAWVAWFWRIPLVIHQQDVHPGLANKLMKPFAKKITVAFEKSLKDFGGTDAKKQVEWIGNPVRSLESTTQTLQLDHDVPTVLIMGGGTGAEGVNTLVTRELCDIANIIHVTGKSRATNAIQHPRYHAHELLGAEYAEVLEEADIVVSRAGLGALTECAAARKPTIFIPMPDSHQELNAQLVKDYDAGVVLNQKELTAETFTSAVKDLLSNYNLQDMYALRIGELMKPGANARFVQVIEEAVA